MVNYIYIIIYVIYIFENKNKKIDLEIYMINNQ